MRHYSQISITVVMNELSESFQLKQFFQSSSYRITVKLHRIFVFTIGLSAAILIYHFRSGFCRPGQKILKTNKCLTKIFMVAEHQLQLNIVKAIRILL
jgi:hypothetical protein